MSHSDNFKSTQKYEICNDHTMIFMYSWSSIKFVVSLKSFLFLYIYIYIHFHLQSRSYVKLCPAVVAILDFQFTEKKIINIAKNNLMIFHKQLRLIKIYGFKDKTLNACSHNVLCATLSCSGHHLGFLINNNKNINLIEGSCKEHYYQVTVPSHMWVLRRHFKF